MSDEANITANELQAAAGAISEAMAGFKVLASEGRNESDRLLSALLLATLLRGSTSSSRL